MSYNMKLSQLGKNLSRDQFCDLMTLKLLFLLKASSDKCPAFEMMALVEKKLLNLVRNRGENRILNWSKNLLNLMKKQGGKLGKIEGLIDEKPLKLNEETKKRNRLFDSCYVAL